MTDSVTIITQKANTPGPSPIVDIVIALYGMGGQGVASEVAERTGLTAGEVGATLRSYDFATTHGTISTGHPNYYRVNNWMLTRETMKAINTGVIEIVECPKCGHRWVPKSASNNVDCGNCWWRHREE